MMDIRVGTSGWSYPEWVGPVYPRGLKPAKMLDVHAQLFTTCEINTTFYNLPADMVVRAWAKKVPDGYTFSAKIHKSITHDALLDFRRIGNGLNTFMNRLAPLDGKIHAYLLQLPPSFSTRHLADLTRFLEFWARNWPPEKLAVEFRHVSWMVDDTFRLLADHDAMYCIVAEPLLPPRVEVTSKHLGKAYIRLHGFGTDPWFNYEFTMPELETWASTIRAMEGTARDVSVYFNNHFSGYAVKNARTLLDLLDIPQPSLEAVQRRWSPDRGQQALDTFLPR